MKVIATGGDRHSTVYECGVCKGGLLFVESPPLPAGFQSGSWQGWFHLDKDCGHFGGVRWASLRESVPFVVRPS